MNDDAALLRRYAEKGSEPDFTALVHRHVDLVYGAALRRCGGDPHCAADVAQQVFSTLAGQAGKLSRHPVLSAWLHTATRNAALNLMISEQRRKARERDAHALEPAAAMGEIQPDWERVRPLLDAAIDDLPEADRGAVVLRFLEQRPFAEIGAALHVSEDAARMRTERALDKLRTLLERRGISSTTAALGVALAGHTAFSAPAGLATSLAAGALAGAGATAGLGGALLFFMSIKTIATGAGLVAALGLGLFLGLNHAASEPLPPPPVTPEHAKMIAALRQEKLALRAEVDRLTAVNATLTAKPVPVAPPRVATVPATRPAPQADIQTVSMQRAMLNNLRQISSAREQFQLENGRPPTSIDELVGETKYIRRLVPVDGENYSALPMGAGQLLTLTSPNGVTVTYDRNGPQTTPTPTPPLPPHLVEMQRRMQPAVEKALAAYQAANNGAKPPNSAAGASVLIPYFATPQEGADFVEYIEAAKQAGMR